MVAPHSDTIINRWLQEYGELYRAIDQPCKTLFVCLYQITRKSYLLLPVKGVIKLLLSSGPAVVYMLVSTLTAASEPSSLKSSNFITYKW